MKPHMLAAIFMCFSIYGCNTSFPRNTPGSTFGQITVNSPRVEGRERLVNDKLDQEQWLQKQLTTIRDAEFGISGATALTSSSYLNAQANIKVDPQYALDALTYARQSQASQSASSDEKAISAFRASARDDIIAKYNKKDYTLKQATDELTALGYSVPATSPGNQPLAKAPDPASAPKSTYLDKDAGARLDAPADAPRKAQLSSTPIEGFQDKLAASEVVQNELNDIRGDDIHDLAGNTLYRLTFDTTVSPYDDTSAWAIVRVRAKINLTGNDSESFLTKVATRYERTLSEAAEMKYRSMLNNIKQKCWEQEFINKITKTWPMEWRKSDEINQQEEATFRRAFLCASRDVDSTTRRTLERHLSAWSAKDKPVLTDNDNKIKIHRANMQDLLLERLGKDEDKNTDIEAFAARQKTLRLWAEWLGEIFDRQSLLEFSQSPLACYYDLESETALSGAFPYHLKSRSSDNLPQCSKLGHTPQSFLMALQKHIKASVYAVTPKESVQRLSEVSSNKKVTELLFGLSAITSAAGVNAAIQSIQANTALYEAIRRQPLVVGFTEHGNICIEEATNCSGELVFGWIFGPSFTLSNDGRSTNFRHTQSQKSVAASLSLPAWIESLGITVETSWRQENGKEVSNDGTRKVGDTFKYRVPLPAIPSEALSSLDTSSPREPRVERYQFLEVVEGSPAMVLINGRNLWRSTQVFIGAQKASSLSILPNYQGIAAYFEKIASPAGSAPSLHYHDGGVDLTVSTSEGYTLAGHVVIKPKDADKQPVKPLEISGVPLRIVASEEQNVSLSKALVATDEAVVQVTTSKSTEFLALLTDTTMLSEDRATVTFTLPAKTVPNLKSGDPISLSLMVKHGRSGGTEVFPIQKNAVYYVQADDAKAKVPATLKLGGPIKLTITLPLNAPHAFAGLASGQPKLTAQAIIKDPEIEESLTGTCTAPEKNIPEKKISKERITCTAQLEGSAQWKAALKKAKEVALTVSFEGKDVPEFVNNKVEIKP